jgi:hypothetical protein
MIDVRVGIISSDQRFKTPQTAVDCLSVHPGPGSRSGSQYHAPSLNSQVRISGCFGYDVSTLCGCGFASEFFNLL